MCRGIEYHDLFECMAQNKRTAKFDSLDILLLQYSGGKLYAEL